MSKEISIIIPSHREGGKPKSLLRDIRNSSNGSFEIDEIYLVTSENVPKLREFCEEINLPVEFISQDGRKGKASAINVALERTENRRVVLVSADVTLEQDTLKNISDGLEDEEVGIVTARPVPKSPDTRFIGFFVGLIWDIHDLLSNKKPKAGEIIGFKKTFSSIPKDTTADEEFIKTLVMGEGFQSKYARDSVVYNTGPENVSKLFKQRKRVYIGHLDLKNRTGYSAPSMQIPLLLGAFLESMENRSFHPYILLSVIFEGFARLCGWVRYKILGDNPYKWEKVD